jgi:hypothetical protein
MTDAEAIDLAVRLTGLERFRVLCSPANTLPAPNAPADFLHHCRAIAAAGGRPSTITIDYGSDPSPVKPCCGGA